MPFDGKEAQFETPALRRARLIEALRGEMPVNHQWQFHTVYEEDDCGTTGCAIGVGIRIGLPISLRKTGLNVITAEDLAEVFGIAPLDAHRIFLSTEAYGCGWGGGVTPAMVADALEKIG